MAGIDNHRTHRRSLVKLMAASGAVGLAGCLGEDTDPDDDDDEAQAVDDDDDVDDESNVLVEAWDSDPGTLDLHEASRVPEVMVLSGLHDSLFVVDFDLELQPHLATGYEMNDDGTEFAIGLRDDVTFHDGTEFDAEIAVWNVERFLELSPVSWNYGPVDSVEATGDHEITFYMEESYPMLPEYLTGPQKGFTTPDAVDEYGDQYGADAVVGTGPVQLEEWARDDEIRLTRFEEYDWGPDYLDNQGPSPFEEYRLRIVPEPTTLVNELTVGNVDGSPFVAPDDISEIEEHENTQVERVDDAHPNFLVLNVEHEPLDEVEVRRAIAYAIDRDGIITAVHDDEAYPLWSLCPPMAEGGMDEETAQEHGYEEDLDRARELLDEAGWTNDGEGETRTRDGEELELTFFAFEMPIYARTGEVVQAMLDRVGIDTHLEILESGTLYDRTEGGEHHILTMALGSGYRAIDTLTSALHGDNYAPEGGFNYSFYRDDEFDDLIDEATYEPDEDRRNELLVEAQERVLEEVPVVPLIGYRKFYGFKNDITGGDWFEHPWWPSSDKYYLNRFEVDRQ